MLIRGVYLASWQGALVTLAAMPTHAWAKSEESSATLTPEKRVAGTSRRRSMMYVAIDRLRHWLCQGHSLDARDTDPSTSLICSAHVKGSRQEPVQRPCRYLCICLKAIVLMQIVDSSNKMPASKKHSFSRRVRDQNLRIRSIAYLQQALSPEIL